MTATPIPVKQLLRELPSAHKAEIARHLLAFFPFVWTLREAEAAGEMNPQVLAGLRSEWSAAFARLDQAVEDFVPEWELVDLLRKLSLHERNELERELLSASQGGDTRAHCSAHQP